MPKLREKMETKQFLRSLAEAKRRYGGRRKAPTATTDCLPDEPRWPDGQEEPARDEED